LRTARLAVFRIQERGRSNAKGAKVFALAAAEWTAPPTTGSPKSPVVGLEAIRQMFAVSSMNAKFFFAKPPKAKRAFLSPYGSQKMRNRYGVRIELEPLLFSDARPSPENEAEVILDHLALPSIVPKELQHTRHKPKAEKSPRTRYEGSCYFLGEHNWVDLNEIRFLTARGHSVRTEYDLIIHLPIRPPNEYPLVLSVSTKVEPDKHKFVPRPPRHVASIGTFTETRENVWECQTSFHGCPITIQLHAEHDTYRKITTFVKEVVVDNAITPTDIQTFVQEQIDGLQWKFDYFKVRTRFKPEQFLPNWFSFYCEDHQDDLRLSICLSDPTDTGRWYLRFRGTTPWHLEWVPNNSHT
jgi:hypothetical protein